MKNYRDWLMPLLLLGLFFLMGSAAFAQATATGPPDEEAIQSPDVVDQPHFSGLSGGTAVLNSAGTAVNPNLMLLVTFAFVGPSYDTSRDLRIADLPTGETVIEDKRLGSFLFVKPNGKVGLVTP